MIWLFLNSTAIRCWSLKLPNFSLTDFVNWLHHIFWWKNLFEFALLLNMLSKAVGHSHHIDESLKHEELSLKSNLMTSDVGINQSARYILLQRDLLIFSRRTREAKNYNWGTSFPVPREYCVVYVRRRRYDSCEYIYPGKCTTIYIRLGVVWSNESKIDQIDLCLFIGKSDKDVYCWELYFSRLYFVGTLQHMT